MAIGITVLKQIIMMFTIMMVGYVLYKKKMLSNESTFHLTNLLIYISTPCIIITAFNIPFDRIRLQKLLIVLLLSLFILGIFLILARIIFKDKHLLEQFAIVFPNSGFFGIPLVIGLLGKEYVFYISVFLVVWNIYMWTIGIYLVSGDKKNMNLKTALTSPAFIGTIIGFLCFFSPVKLPTPIAQAVSYMGDMNTPLAMIVLGSYLARDSLKTIFENKMNYFVSLLRLIILPIVSLFILRFVPNYYYELKLVVLIATSAPTGLMVAMLAEQFGGDYEYGAKIICLSTILCLISIPIIMTLTTIIW